MEQQYLIEGANLVILSILALGKYAGHPGRFGPSTKAFIVVPLVGAFFIDLSNAMVIKLFVSMPLLLEGLNIPGQ